MAILSKGFNCAVYTTSNEEVVGKLFKGETSPQEEFTKLTIMGEISPIIVKAISIKKVKGGELLLMERLYPLQPRAIDKATRLTHLEKFFQELNTLHSNGWVHGDIKRPIHACRGDGDQWDNVIPTLEGIRLIDVGEASNKENNPLWEQDKQKDLIDFCEFSRWFMKDVIPEKEMIPILRGWLGV